MTKENARSTKQQQIIMYINGCDFIEVLGIWDAKASHPMLMTPLLEMALICSSSPVTLVSTNLTLEFLINYSSQNVSGTVPDPMQITWLWCSSSGYP
jgi:hypothetical protein